MPCDQLPMPTQQRPRSHDPDPQQIRRQHPGERRQHEPVPRLQPWTSHLPPQHRHLMPQHQQFHVFRCLATTTGHDKSQQHPEARVQRTEQHSNDHAGATKHGRAEVFEPHTLGNAQFP